MGLFLNKKLPLIDRFDSIALADAVLCVNCNTITAAKNGHCPACGSPSLCNLKNILDGGENETLQNVRELSLGNRRFRSARLFQLVPRRQ